MYLYLFWYESRYYLSYLSNIKYLKNNSNQLLNEYQNIKYQILNYYVFGFDDSKYLYQILMQP